MRKLFKREYYELTTLEDFQKLEDGTPLLYHIEDYHDPVYRNGIKIAEGLQMKDSRRYNEETHTFEPYDTWLWEEVVKRLGYSNTRFVIIACTVYKIDGTEKQFFEN